MDGELQYKLKLSMVKKHLNCAIYRIEFQEKRHIGLDRILTMHLKSIKRAI